jgi:hypothetical protein
MHEANIGAQFWARGEESEYNGYRNDDKTFGAVSQGPTAGGPNVSAVIEMTRDLESHVVQPHEQELEDNHQQGLLFHSQPATPWLVHGMYAHGDMTHHVPALLGLASTHSKATTGSVPEASPLLSVHSKRVVDRLVKAKLVKNPINNESLWRPNAITRQQGGDFAESMRIGGVNGDTPVPVSDVVAASESYRAAIRASNAPKAPKARRKKNPARNNNQGRLF